MPNIFKLDDIRLEAERRYAPTVIELGEDKSVTLTALLRLGEKDRKEVLDIVGKIHEVDEDLEEAEAEAAVTAITEKLFEKIADKPKRLLKALDDEDSAIKSALHMQVLSAWMHGSQLGEAESSPS
ncbi:tail assembly chaperone [Gordonia phage Anon]|nr:tail assembly chaperone [Gordonia phage Anon]